MRVGVGVQHLQHYQATAAAAAAAATTTTTTTTTTTSLTRVFGLCAPGSFNALDCHFHRVLQSFGGNVVKLT